MKTLSIKRYEIYYADLNPTIGSEIKKVRPVVIISQDEMNKYLGTFFRENHPKIKPSYGTNQAGFFLNIPL
jgi:hypothetical protein